MEIDEAEDPLAKAEESDNSDGPSNPRGTPSSIVNHAMQENDHQAVLRELYREVTGIADVIWTTEDIPNNPLWNRVSTNPWYEQNFAKLDLRPLSDFYELISQVRTKRKNGASKSEIQGYLNESKFAPILISLRDMFQKNHL